MLGNNGLALAATFAVALLWLRLNDMAAERGWIDPHLSRKLIHIGTGPFFVLCWLLFTESSEARFLAALVPAAITLQFILVGMGVIKDEAAVQAMSRSGDRREILRGPLLYGLVFVAATLIYWRDSAIGIVALMLMCGGDGLADVAGRRFGRQSLPWAAGKTWIGSAAMFIGGLSFTVIVLLVYQAAGFLPNPVDEMLTALVLIALGGTLVESLPIKDLDNLTVTVSAAILGHLLLV